MRIFLRTFRLDVNQSVSLWLMEMFFGELVILIAYNDSFTFVMDVIRNVIKR
jgi:hypothetical protein